MRGFEEMATNREVNISEKGQMNISSGESVLISGRDCFHTRFSIGDCYRTLNFSKNFNTDSFIDESDEGHHKWRFKLRNR